MGKCGALPLQNLVIILNNITGKISSPTNGVTEKAIIGHHHHHRHHLSSPSSPIEHKYKEKVAFNFQKEIHVLQYDTN